MKVEKELSLLELYDKNKKLFEMNEDGTFIKAKVSEYLPLAFMVAIYNELRLNYNKLKLKVYPNM